jgi:HK97 family phage major capsid protein
MARNTYESWIPEEYDSEVITRVQAASAVEALATRVPMKSDTKSIPRSGAVDVEIIGKGGTYGEDGADNDAITLIAKKFGKAIRIAEEDINDSLADIVDTKSADWGTSYGKALDNCTLAVTAAYNGTTVPFTSVYNLLNTTDSTQSYTAGDNITKTTSAGVTYDVLNSFITPLEDGDYYEDGQVVIIAHPTFKSVFRGVKDLEGRPIFLQGLAGTPDTLFQIPVRWSNGARTSATGGPAPTGNPLLVAVNKNYLRLGIRSGPESIFIDGSNGLGALTDESILKMRARRGFALGTPHAAAILEKTS